MSDRKLEMNELKLLLPRTHELDLTSARLQV